MKLKFLIVRLSSLGDIVHSLPLVYELRQNYPDSQIDWLVGQNGVSLLSLIKELNNIYEPSLKNLLLIQKQKYDYVIDVQGLFKSAFLSKLSLGKEVIGFKNTREFADIFYDEKVNVGHLFNTKEHIVDLNLKLISQLTKNENSKVKFLIPKINKSNNVEILPRSVVVFPGTTWKSKIWPMEYWFELLANISKDFQIYLCASDNDLKFVQPLINKLNSNKVNYKNLIGLTTVPDLIYLIQNSILVIGMDSFGLHLASAIKNDFGSLEVIGIYGPTSPFRSGPYNSVKDCFYLSELECIGCRKKVCPLGHHNCMNQIVPSCIQDKILSKTSLVKS